MQIHRSPGSGGKGHQGHSKHKQAEVHRRSLYPPGLRPSPHARSPGRPRRSPSKRKHNTQGQSPSSPSQSSPESPVSPIPPISQSDTHVTPGRLGGLPQHSPTSPGASGSLAAQRLPTSHKSYSGTHTTSGHTTSPAHKQNAGGMRPDTKLSLIILMVVLVIVMGAAILALVRARRRLDQGQGAQTTGPQCSTGVCTRYGQLLSETVDFDQPPCTDFYKHVCGGWVKNHPEKTTPMGVAWEAFIEYIVSGLEELQLNEGSREMVNQAFLHLRSCMRVINHSNVANVKRVLERGGIRWPYRPAKPDFLNSLLYMSRRVFNSVVLRLAMRESKGKSTLLWVAPTHYYSYVPTLTENIRTKHRRQHLTIMYKEFAGTVNETRLDELMKSLAVMDGFMETWQKVGNDSVYMNNTDGFLKYAPSVDRKRWEDLLLRYTEHSFSFYNGVEIESVSYFSSFFLLHQTTGEEVMSDIIDTLSVHSLVKYTSPSIITSFYQEELKAAEEHRKDCFKASYAMFGFAFNHYVLMKPHETKAERAVTELAKSVSANYPVMRARTDVVGTWVSNEIPDSAGPALSPPDEAFQGVFDILNRSTPTHYPLSYRYSPSMTSDPLENWLRLANYLLSRPSEANASRIEYDQPDFVKFINFKMMVHYLMFPFYDDGAPLGVVYGGLGSRMSAVLFHDHVKKSGRDPMQVYRKNQQCLTGNPEPLDKNLQGAVAAASLIGAVYGEASKHHHDRSVLGGVTPFRGDQLPFVAGCYLLCGEEAGPQLCNTPLQHSHDFARAFACPNGSAMNPETKCSMFA